MVSPFSLAYPTTGDHPWTFEQPPSLSANDNAGIDPWQHQSNALMCPQSRPVPQPSARSDMRDSRDSSNDHLFPTETEQQALYRLKDYPNRILARWFDLARRGLPANSLAIRFPAPQTADLLDVPTAMMLPSLQPSSIPVSIEQANADLEAISKNAIQADSSPWPLPSKPPVYPWQQAQQTLSTPPQLWSVSSPSSSPASCDLHSNPNSVASFTSAPLGSSPFPGTGTSIYIAPWPTPSPNDGNDQYNHQSDGQSLNICSKSSAKRLSPTPQRARAAALPYLCTFCDSLSTFKSKHEWKRHERSHVPHVEYVCLPKGAIISFNKHHVCAICGVSEPRADHMNEHKMHLCLYKPLEDRTYTRKDKFTKHLRVHGLSPDSAQVKGWSRELLPEKVLGCGFCVQYFSNFEDRFQHVAEHFEQGCRKESWSRSTVLLSLLTQPFVKSEWQSLQGGTFPPHLTSHASWPESSSTDALQAQLESGTGSSRDLAVAAYNLSYLCSGQRAQFHDTEPMETSADLWNATTREVDLFNLS